MNIEFGELLEKVLPVLTQTSLLDRYRENYEDYLEHLKIERLASPDPGRRNRLLGRIEILEEVLKDIGLGGPMEMIKRMVARRG